MNELNQDTRLRRVRYRSWHRGCKETDVILGRFADERLETLNGEQLTIYEKLIDEQDVDIWNWLVGKEPATDAAYLPLLDLLRAHSDRANG
ncbi:MAG: succinate dehydrogenase assembly factor 2 [Rickettsiales bacterium]|nr:succinate dehydrogenase assembly factor 2 [Rickettsiales bacterium]